MSKNGCFLSVLCFCPAVLIISSSHNMTNSRGSYPDSVTGIDHEHNPSGRTMALTSTQPLREMSARNTSWWVKTVSVRANNSTTFICRLSRNRCASTSRITQGLPGHVQRLLYRRRVINNISFFGKALILFAKVII
jgi:hypothetical protein